MLIKVTVKDYNFKAQGEDSRNKNQQKTDLMNAINKVYGLSRTYLPLPLFGFQWRMYFVELRNQNAIKIQLS